MLANEVEACVFLPLLRLYPTMLACEPKIASLRIVSVCLVSLKCQLEKNFELFRPKERKAESFQKNSIYSKISALLP